MSGAKLYWEPCGPMCGRDQETGDCATCDNECGCAGCVWQRVNPTDTVMWICERYKQVPPTPFGCICPPGSNLTCNNPICPRGGPTK